MVAISSGYEYIFWKVYLKERWRLLLSIRRLHFFGPPEPHSPHRLFSPVSCHIADRMGWKHRIFIVGGSLKYLLERFMRAMRGMRRKKYKGCFEIF
jgi:hypothetical protein